MQRIVALVLLLLSACESVEVDEMASYQASVDTLRFAGELHLRNVRQLTFGGNNAEAYWSFDDSKLIFQSDWQGINPQGCDQNFVIEVQGAEAPVLISTGLGRTTCGYFLPDGRQIYASTHVASEACPPPPAGGQYRWPIYDAYDIYVTSAEGRETPELLVGGPGYDAEATVSPDGRYVVFTSTRSGDLELWRYELATGALLQLTHTLGYDGGAFFSRDSQQIVWRASRPVGDDARAYRDLLRQNLVAPSDMNIFVADADGANARQVTKLPGANWAPFFHPAGDRVIFSSNFESTGGGGRPVFSLYIVSTNGGEPVKITHSNTFDAFPMFSFDGTKLAFASNRNVDRVSSRETNIFVADWVEVPHAVDSNFVAPRR